MAECFLEYCESGNLEELKKLDYTRIDIHDRKEHAFRMACGNGHLEVVKYLIWLGENGHKRINIHAMFNHAFRLACHAEHLDVADYLISLYSTYDQITMTEDCGTVFYSACLRKQVNVVKYLISIKPIYGSYSFRNYVSEFYLFDLSIQHILFTSNPNYDWIRINGYIDYVHKINHVVENLVILHAANIKSDIFDSNVLGIVKEYLI